MGEIAPVAAQQDLAQVDQAVDRLLDRREFPGRRAVAVFHLSVVLEERHVVGGGLDAQHDAVLVVHLDRALAEAVLDAGALDPGGELRADLLRQQRRDLPAEERWRPARPSRSAPTGGPVAHRAGRGWRWSGTPDRWRIPPASGSSDRTARTRRIPGSTAWHTDPGCGATGQATERRPVAERASSRRSARRHCRPWCSRCPSRSACAPASYGHCSRTAGGTAPRSARADRPARTRRPGSRNSSAGTCRCPAG